MNNNRNELFEDQGPDTTRNIQGSTLEKGTPQEKASLINHTIQNKPRSAVEEVDGTRRYDDEDGAHDPDPENSSYALFDDGQSRLVATSRKSRSQVFPQPLEGEPDVQPLVFEEMDDLHRGTTDQVLNWMLKIDQPKQKKGLMSLNLGNGVRPEVNENDVYPLSISYSFAQKSKMRMIRILVFLSMFYWLVPFDLYIRNIHSRIYWWGTDVYKYRVDYNRNDPAWAYTFDLTNCKVYLYQDSDPTDNFLIELGLEFGRNFTMTDRKLTVAEEFSEECVMNLYLPFAPLPTLIFKMKGTEDNIIWDDSHVNNLNFSNGLAIIGQTVYIAISNHDMSFLYINLTSSSLELSNVTTYMKYIDVNYGSYSEIVSSATPVVYMELNQTDGNICLGGGEIIQMPTTSCPVLQKQNITKGGCQYDAVTTDGIRNANWPSVAPSVKQSISDFKKISHDIERILEDPNASINIPKAAIPISLIKVPDGTIQVLYRMKTFGFTKYNPYQTAILFARASLHTLNQSATDYFVDTTTDKISILQTIAPLYSREWLYTNKFAFIQAQFWPLVWGSAGILRPKIDSQKVYMVDYECPSRPPGLGIDLEISNFYKEFFPKQTFSSVNFVEGYNNFFKVESSDVGETRYVRINFQDNQLIVTAFAVSGTVALVGAAFCVHLVLIVAKAFKIQYQKYVTDQKAIAITRMQMKLFKKNGTVDNQAVLANFSSTTKIYENRGLIWTSFYEDAERIARTQMEFKFSLYQVPALLLDWYFRKNADSLGVFLNELFESNIQLSEARMNRSDKARVSIKTSEFREHYGDFCCKYGYTESQDLAGEAAETTFERFGLSVEAFDGDQEPAYMHIRFKSMKEKTQNEFIDSEALRSKSIDFFLQSECVYSQFESDYITNEDLKLRYQFFCNFQKIPETQKEFIVGSPGLIKFGATPTTKDPPMRILGIIKGKPDQIMPDYKFELIRKPINYLQTDKKVNPLGLKQWFIHVDGIVPNAVLAIIHFVIIHVVVLATPLITFQALCNMTQLQSNVFGKVVSFGDFFTTNRLQPWWNLTPHLDIAAYIHIYVIIYLVFAYIEVFSFYFTGYDNNGKYPVAYSFLKRLLMFSFYISAGIFLYLYAAMLLFALAWACLAAIINPAAFLAITSAALTLIVTVLARLRNARQTIEDFKKNIEVKIKEHIANAFQSCLEAVKEKGEAIFGGGSMDGLNNIDPQAAADQLQSGLENVILQAADPNVNLKQLVLNDVKSLAVSLSNNIGGVSPEIVEILIAISCKDLNHVQTCAYNLGNKLKIDGELLGAITALVLCEFNPQKNGAQQAYGELEPIIKRILEKVAPNLGVQDTVGDICSLVFGRDLTKVVDIIESIGESVDSSINFAPYVQCFKILTYAFENNTQELKGELLDMVQGIMKQEVNAEFLNAKTLLNLKDGQFEDLLQKMKSISVEPDNSSQQIGFRHNYQIISLSEFFTKGKTLQQDALHYSVIEIQESAELVSKEDKEQIENEKDTNNEQPREMEKYFMGLKFFVDQDQNDLIIHAQKINKINHDSEPIILDNLMILQRISQNSLDSLDKLLPLISIQENRDCVKDLYLIMNKKMVKLYNICEKFMLPEAMYENFTRFIYLFYLMGLYEFNQKRLYEYKKNIKNKTEEENEAIRQNIAEEYQQVKTNIISCLVGVNAFDLRKLDWNNFYVQLIKSIEKIGKDLQKKLLFSEQPELDIIPDKYKTTTSFQIILDITVQLCFPQDKELQKSTIVRQQLDKSRKPEPFSFSSQLWDWILSQLKSSSEFPKQDVLTLIKYCSVILLRLDDKIEVDDPIYLEIIRTSPQLLGIPSEKIEFIIDLMSGRPINIFKVESKFISYDLNDTLMLDKKPQITDSQREDLLQTVLGGCGSSLNQLFYRWHHLYKTQTQAKQAFSEGYQKELRLDTKFLDFIQSLKSNFGEPMQELKHNISSSLTQYLRRQIIFSKSQTLQPVKAEVTAKFFADHSAEYPINPRTLVNLQEEERLFMYRLIQMKELKKEALLELLRSPKPGIIPEKTQPLPVKPFKSLLSIESNAHPQQILDFIMQFSNTFYQEKRRNNSRSSERSDFIGLVLLLNAYNIQSISSGYRLDPAKLRECVNKILLINGDNYPGIGEREAKDFLAALSENLFLGRAGRLLCTPLIKDHLRKKAACQPIIGLLLGSAIQNQALIRSSFVQLFRENNQRTDIIEGALALFQEDYEAFDQYKSVCQHLEINPQFVQNLLDLQNNHTQNLFGILIDLHGSYIAADDKKLSQSFLALLKNDFTPIKTLTTKLCLEHTKAIPILAAALGNEQILSESSHIFMQCLRLNNPVAVQTVLELARGNPCSIQQLAKMCFQDFQIYDPVLAAAIFKITYLGNQLYNKKLFKPEPSQFNGCDIFITKVAEKFLASSNIEETETCSSFVLKMKALVKACWNNQGGINTIINFLEHSKSPIWQKQQSKKGVANEILTGAEKRELLRAGLIALAKNLFEIKNKITKKQQQMIGAYATTLKNLIAEDGDNGPVILNSEQKQKSAQQDVPEAIQLLGIPNDNDDQDGWAFSQANKVIQELSQEIETVQGVEYKVIKDSLAGDTQLQNAYKLGCTYGLGLKMKIKQPFYICATCNRENNSIHNYGICYTCAKFCHKDHQIELASEELWISESCDCGSGSFDACPSMNKNNPVIMLQGIKSCSVIHKTFRAIQVQQQMETKQEDQLVIPASTNKKMAQYKVDELLMDLNDSLDFRGVNGALTDGKLHDKMYGIDLTMTVNIILLANGGITDSLLSVMSVKKEFHQEDLSNADPYHNQKTISNASFKALKTLVAIGRGEINEFQSYGNGLAYILKERGNRKESAVEKLSHLILLTNGGCVPILPNTSNTYSLLFSRIFGTHWLQMILLHKMLTVPKFDLLQILGIAPPNNDLFGDSEQEAHRVYIEKLKKMTDEELFTNGLGFAKSSTLLCKNIAGLMYKNAPSLDYIAQKKSISATKVKILKAVLFNRAPDGIDTFFSQIAKVVPKIIVEHMKNLLFQPSDFKSLFNMIADSSRNMDTKIIWDKYVSLTEIEQMGLEHVQEYIFQLYSLMSNQAINPKKSIEYILDQLNAKTFGGEDDNKTIFYSMYGIIAQDQHIASNIAKKIASNTNNLNEETLSSILSVMKGQVTAKELKDISYQLYANKVQLSNEAIALCIYLIAGLNGDMASTARFVEKLRNEDSCIASLMIGLISNKTVYDQTIDDKVQYQKSSNSIIREMFRIYELSAKYQFGDQAGLLIRKSFDENVPLYLMLQMNQNRSFIEKIFRFNEAFANSITDEIIPAGELQAKKNFIEDFTDYLDPMVAEDCLKQVTDVIFKTKKDFQLTLNVLPPIGGIGAMMALGQSFEINIQSFLKLMFDCLGSDDIQAAVTKLFHTYLIPALGNTPILQQILLLQQSIINQQNIFENLAPLVKFVMKKNMARGISGRKVDLKAILNDDLDVNEREINIYALISDWFQVFMYMLSKDKKTPMDVFDKLMTLIQNTVKNFEGEIDHPFCRRKEDALYISDVIQGLTSCVKGDFQGILPLAVKIGGFPDGIEDKLEEIIELVKQNKEGINFKSAAGFAAGNLTELAISNLGLPGGEKAVGIARDVVKAALDDPSELFSPKFIFAHFAGEDGQMDFDQFCNIPKQFGFRIPQAKLLQFFAMADKDKSSSISYTEFRLALDELKEYLIQGVMVELGVTVQDMAIALASAIVMLILMFAFIFVGIGAFAPKTAFASATNSIFPILAGRAVNKEEKKDTSVELPAATPRKD